MTQLLLGIAPEWQPTLENFVVGRNGELMSALRHAIDEPASLGSLYLWGEAGSGKSHLLLAAAAWALEASVPSCYLQGSLPDLATLEDAQLVVLDDVEALGEAEQIALFSLYNRLRESGGLLLVSGSVAPAHLAVRDDLRTRLGWGLVYQVQALSDDEKAEALNRHAGARGFILPSEVTQYLLRHGRRDLPSLLAVLDALDQHCLRLKRAPSVPLLKEVMQSAQA